MVSKGVKDLSSRCVEQEKGVWSRRREFEAGRSGRSRSALRVKEDLARPRVLRSGGGVGRSLGHQGAPSTTETDEFPAHPWALESPD